MLSTPSRHGDRQEESYNNWPNYQGFDPNYEEHGPTELTVNGCIPTYVAGLLYRTGPGGYKVDTDDGKTFDVSHWFDGFSQVHRFQIVAPDFSHPHMRVFYNSRLTVDSLVEEIRKTGSWPRVSFGQKHDPCQSYFKKVMSTFTPEPSPKDSSLRNMGVTLSVNMPGLSNLGTNQSQYSVQFPRIKTLHTKTDANGFKQIDPETLEPICLVSQDHLHPDLNGSLSGAHARSDPITGDVFNYNLAPGAKPAYRVFSVSASTGKTTILATFSATPAYIHSFFLATDYVILCVWNSHISGDDLAHGNILDAIIPFDPLKPALWYVIDRKHGNGLIATYESHAFYCFHTINAWQEPSAGDPTKVDIVADMAMYDNLDALKHFYYENILSTATAAKDFAEQMGDSIRPALRRFRLPAIPLASTKELQQTSIDWTAEKKSSPELPTINPSYATCKHRFTYGVADRGRSTFVDGIVKFDNETRMPLFWEQDGHSPGEPIFVADPQGKMEDDGVLLSVVLDGISGRSYLLCLDARKMIELGRASVGGVVGFGFHGCHVPAVGKLGGEF